MSELPPKIASAEEVTQLAIWAYRQGFKAAVESLQAAEKATNEEVMAKAFRAMIDNLSNP